MFFKSQKNRCVCCGGAILYEPGAEVGFCEYCDVMQTLEQPDFVRDNGDEMVVNHIATRSVDTPSSAEQIALCLKGKADALTFGKYIQIPDGEPEPIEWLVLAREKDRILVLSKYALDSRRYHESFPATWETCTLRSFLNGEFLDFAFSEEEKALIPSAFVSADDNPEYNTDPGNDTMDRVFLLSIGEVERYFGPKYSRRECLATAYCNYALDRPESHYDGSCRWWLRSPGSNSERAAYVNYNGHFILYGNGGNCCYDMAVRPAMWLTLGNSDQ